jgi:UDP-N-acetylmuramate dehydrogenase
MELTYQEGVLLKTHTTLKVGGTARYFVTVTTKDEVSEAVRFAQQKGLPFLVVGGGSNLLVSDEGYEGVVIQMAVVGRVYVAGSVAGEVILSCGAGEMLDSVIEDTVMRGCWGLENLSAIPGTVGATPVQNVGAYGVEVKDCVVKVTVYDTITHEWKELTNEECRFGYRDSVFKTDEGKHYIVSGVTFKLGELPQPNIDYADLARVFGNDEAPSLSEIRDAIIAIRAEKFPDWRVIGTAGSFFKNPVIPRAEALALQTKFAGLPLFDVDDAHMKLSLGYILDKVCHLKGYRHGEVGLYQNQALVLVNYGQATASDIFSFVSRVTCLVEEATGIHIEPEVRYIK